MGVVQCQTCGGVYATTSDDGVRYFHACPPLTGPDGRAAVATGAVTLTKAQAQRLAALDLTAPDAVSGVTGTQRGDSYLASLALPRPNFRNENIDLAKVKALRNPDTGNLPTALPVDALVISAGAGVAVVVDDPVPVKA